MEKPTETTTRSTLTIDLNETPTSSASSPTPPGPTIFDLVRSFHDDPDPSPGILAEIPEACVGGNERAVVCDGCEREFDVEWAGEEEEWLCEECVRGGERSKRWPVGAKRKRILDMNASPPSDVDLEEMGDLRRNIPGHKFNFVDEIGALGNGNGCKIGSELLMQAMGVGYDALQKHVGTNAGDVDLGFPLGRLDGRLPYWNPSEILLQGLKEFVSERNGVLEEGWSVELKHSTGSNNIYAVYRSPDGKTFGSVSEVAYHLGLMQQMSNSMNKDGRRDGALPQEKFRYYRKRRSKKGPYANDLSENKDKLENGLHGNSQGIEISDATFNKVMGVKMREDCVSVSQSSNEGLPVQFEDFFILSLGKIDVRPSYHDVCVIWPVGYRSCWHDKITGSIFVCEVSDGGDCGPLFRISRFSCSICPVPDASTVLYMTNPGHITAQSNKESDKSICHMDCEDDGCIEMILADPSPPMDCDILGCLGNQTNENCRFRTSNSQQSGFPCNWTGDFSLSGLGIEHTIGEITVEERSSKFAWKIISQKLIDAYSDMHRRGKLNFSCSHFDGAFRSILDAKCGEAKEKYASMKKFCGFPDFVSMLNANDDQLNALAVLSNWLDQDRFGLDTDFVQEMLEKLPGAVGCSRYELLRNRVYYSKSITIGNGLLVTKRKNKKNSVDCFESSERPSFAESTKNVDPPPGKLLCSRLPSMLFGDVYQVWELLWRFHDILGFKEPLSLEKLEGELVNQWSDSSSHFRKPEIKIDESHVQVLQRLDSINGQVSSLQSMSSEACLEDNLYSFKERETSVVKDDDQTRFSSATHGQCSATALTKVYISLLTVLVTELLSKVAAFVDPNFDSGEFKSKRGRRKDTDNAILARKSKLNMLPINELTWPELARRYILGVLAMDGNLDSSEITARESARVFRCLQGDGGMLCGSLTGIAGMEADALLLAGSVKKVFGALGRGKDFITLEEEVTVAGDVSEKGNVIDDVPEWAKLLEPVKKLPTNVGTRIRKCVNDALEKCPPEWAEERLKHSISKAVYKGNASGPTKKAVLAVLEDMRRENLRQHSEKRNKQKITLPISEIIMKKCRCILRHAAAADTEKRFCTLLGTNLENSCDNDDEGLLGSPAMVSRPLDFRTIDLRLAVGAYGGSCESFLEDVREVWNNIRVIFADRPDYVELAGTLSENFESLYEKEVIPLLQKFEGYAKLDRINVEIKKEINDICASVNEIPKAPWDEGICKVCGVDKNDDSVLLCDICDAEYHTYCLNPPLTRIPEGNWYCPSCIVGEHEIQERSTFILGRHFNKCQEKVTRIYLEHFIYLASAMEERDYWDFSLDERVFMLKLLCDEFLNSSLVHQHLEHCVETTAELQQKLRSFSAELKNLKSREEFLVSKAAKKDNSSASKEGITSSDNFPATESGQAEVRCKHSEIYESGTSLKKKQNCASQNGDPMDTEGQAQDLNGAVPSQQIDGSVQHNLDQKPSSHSPKHVDGIGKTHLRGNLQDVGRDSASLFPSDNEGISQVSEMNDHFTLHTLLDAVDVSQAFHVELNATRGDIHNVQNSINSIVSQLLNLSLRTEFLGSDSRGYLYWASNMPGRCPQIIVDRSLTMQNKEQNDQKIFSDEILDSHSLAKTSLNQGGSKACFPFMCNPSSVISASSSWVCYATDAEIEGLLGWLKEIDPKEKELKDSISQWIKVQLQVTQQTGSLGQLENQAALSITNCDEAVLSTKAALYLEKKYGAFVDFNTNEIPKHLEKKMIITGEERVYRCSCLEPTWPSRLHCASCHRTFSHSFELDAHNDGRCHLISLINEKNGNVSNSENAKRNVQSDASKVECVGKMDVVETSESSLSGTSFGLIQFQRKDSVCPFNLEEITSKFLTKDSNHELVQEIGLIGLNGVPSFVTSISPYLSDSTLSLISSPRFSGVDGDWFKVDQKRIFPVGNRGEVAPDNLHGNEANYALHIEKPPLGCLEHRERKSASNKNLHDTERGHCFRIPQLSLKPLPGKFSRFLQRLQCNLLDMEAALSDEALRPSRAKLDHRAAWRAYVKSSVSIFEMVQATIILEEMIKTEFLRNDWWYWSSLSAAAKISTVASLALRIYSLDAAIIYENNTSNSDPTGSLNVGSAKDEKLPCVDSADKCKVSRKSNRKRKELDS